METYFFKRDKSFYVGIGDLCLKTLGGFVGLGPWAFRWRRKSDEIPGRKAFKIFSFRAFKREWDVKIMPCHSLMFGATWAFGFGVICGPLCFGVYP